MADAKVLSCGLCGTTVSLNRHDMSLLQHRQVLCEGCGPLTGVVGDVDASEEEEAVTGLPVPPPITMHGLLVADSPCTFSAESTPDGGAIVKLHVPTYGGGATFALFAERSGDDWIVHVPWPDSIDDQGRGLLPTGDPSEVGYDVVNGVLYLGAPDEPVQSNYDHQTGGCS